jgi:hypothetical protein
MSFHTDAMDAVNAFVAVRNSMKGDSRDAYYDWLLQNDPAYQMKKAKEEQDRRDKAAAKAAAAQQQTAGPAPVTSSGINMPAMPPSRTIGPAPGGGGFGGFGAISTTPNTGTIQGQPAYYSRRGGVIPHYEDGTSSVEPIDVRDPETGALSPEQIMQIRRMAGQAEAERVARSQPKAISVGNPNTLNRSARESGYDPGPRPPQEPSAAEVIGPQAAAPYLRPPGQLPQSMTPEEIARITRSRVSQEGVTPDQARDPRLAGTRPPVREVTDPSAAPYMYPPTEAPTQTTPVTPQPLPTTAGGARPQPPPAQGPVNPDISPYGNAGETALYRAEGKVPREGAPGAPTTEPPPGSIAIPGVGGSSAPGGGGGGPGGGVGRRSARPRLGDQTRREQYDPTLDAEDPGNVRPVFAGGAVNPVQYAKIQDAAASYDKALAGGTHFAEFLTRRGENHPHSEPSRLALHSGVGAMPVPVAQAVVAAWDMGGKLKPPDAMIRYMMGTYEILTERGQTAAANQMAFEVIQRLNLEAARHGQVALQQLRQGDVGGATKTIAEGHRWSPDGKIMQTSPDGRYIGMYDQFTGKPTSPPMRVTPQMILAGALSLSDGTGMWNHLASRAQLFLQAGKGTDKDAEGRAIRNRNNLLRGVRLEQMIRKGDAPKVGGAVGPPPSMTQFRQEARTTQPSSGNKTTIINQGDGGDIMRDDVGTREDDD